MPERCGVATILYVDCLVPDRCLFTLRRREARKPIRKKMIHYQDQSGRALMQHKNRTEISVSPVNKRPIRYGFRASAGDIRYGVAIVTHDQIKVFCAAQS